MPLVEPYGFDVRHVGWALLQRFGYVDAGTAVLEMRPIQFEPFALFHFHGLRWYELDIAVS